ncbi:hypothetical protein E2C01_051599 [Portunus trituberculatus]|uniref:Uncharacterized protein n=1 Tax=Portunus trituberculatus TaxID=210409 RepID=A0A5B7GM78_PORTR|nr:hypothetical protein [Portunus trituberculatus]
MIEIEALCEVLPFNLTNSIISVAYENSCDERAVRFRIHGQVRPTKARTHIATDLHETEHKHTYYNAAFRLFVGSERFDLRVRH